MANQPNSAAAGTVAAPAPMGQGGNRAANMTGAIEQGMAKFMQVQQQALMSLMKAFEKERKTEAQASAATGQATVQAVREAVNKIEQQHETRRKERRQDRIMGEERKFDESMVEKRDQLATAREQRQAQREVDIKEIESAAGGTIQTAKLKAEAMAEQLILARHDVVATYRLGAYSDEEYHAQLERIATWEALGQDSTGVYQQYIEARKYESIQRLIDGDTGGPDWSDLAGKSPEEVMSILGVPIAMSPDAPTSTQGLEVPPIIPAEERLGWELAGGLPPNGVYSLAPDDPLREVIEPPTAAVVQAMRDDMNFKTMQTERGRKRINDEGAKQLMKAIPLLDKITTGMQETTKLYGRAVSPAIQKAITRLERDGLPTGDLRKDFVTAVLEEMNHGPSGPPVAEMALKISDGTLIPKSPDELLTAWGVASMGKAMVETGASMVDALAENDAVLLQVGKLAEKLLVENRSTVMPLLGPNMQRSTGVRGVAGRVLGPVFGEEQLPTKVLGKHLLQGFGGALVDEGGFIHVAAKGSIPIDSLIREVSTVTASIDAFLNKGDMTKDALDDFLGAGGEMSQFRSDYSQLDGMLDLNEEGLNGRWRMAAESALAGESFPDPAPNASTYDANRVIIEHTNPEFRAHFDKWRGIRATRAEEAIQKQLAKDAPPASATDTPETQGLKGQLMNPQPQQPQQAPVQGGLEGAAMSNQGQPERFGGIDPIVDQEVDLTPSNPVGYTGPQPPMNDAIMQRMRGQ